MGELRCNCCLSSSFENRFRPKYVIFSHLDTWEPVEGADLGARIGRRPGSPLRAQTWEPVEGVDLGDR